MSRKNNLPMSFLNVPIPDEQDIFTYPPKRTWLISATNTIINNITPRQRCSCGYRIRGKDHVEGSHHKNPRKLKS